MNRLTKALLSRLPIVGDRAVEDRSADRVEWPIDSATGFPEGRYFATLGDLARNYGGTSSVVFHRSKAIVEQTGIPVDILTFGHRRDYEALNEEFQADGRFVPGLRFRNMWLELAAISRQADESSRDSFPDFSPLAEQQVTEIRRDEGVKIQKVRQSSEGKDLQIDMCRPDGTVIVSDRRDLTFASGKARRSLILCDTAGAPVQEFGSIAQLRTHWLDKVIGQDRAVLFSDTFGVAGFMHTYKRPNALVVQTFHNRHLAMGVRAPFGETEPRYLPFLNNIDDFDATVFLTERQRNDVDALMGTAVQRWVVPNSLTIPEKPGLDLRDSSRAVVIGRLVPGKQVDHAIRAIAVSNEQLEMPTTLDIFGDGSARAQLEHSAAEFATGSVYFHGHVSGAASAFARSSFSFLTSRSEAMSLALIESMSRGCLPIAYDIEYGTSDIITHGVDGFLVPADDVEALTETILQVRSMDEPTLRSMRASAVSKAQKFSDDAVVKRWGEVLRETSQQKVRPEHLTVDGTSTAVSVDGAYFHIEVSGRTQRPLFAPRFHVVIKGRNFPAIARIDCRVEKLSGMKFRVQAQIAAPKISWVDTGILDVSLEIHDRAGRTDTRVKAPAPASLEKESPFAGFDLYSTIHGNLSLKKK